jgi:DNA replication protein DnaC
VITSQLPQSLWHESIGDLTIAHIVLDRLRHQAHSINLSGESLRKNDKARLIC